MPEFPLEPFPDRQDIVTRKYRFMTLLSLLLIVGFLFTSVISYFVAHDSLSEQIAGNSLPLTSDNIYSEIQQDLLRPIFISSLMAHDTFVRDWVLGGETDPEKMVRYLREIKKRYATVTSFFVSDLSRNYYHSSGILKTVTKEDPQDGWYFRMPELTDDYQVNIDRDTADLSSMTIFINHKVFDYIGNYIGTIGVGLDVKSVKSLIETYQQRYGRTIFFTDRQGKITLVGSKFNGPHDLREIPGLSPYVTQVLTAPSTSLSFKQDGRTSFFNSRFVEPFDWYLVVLEQDPPGETRIQKTLLLNIIISLAITAVVLAIAGMTIGNYQKKLETMATTDKLTGVANRQIFDFLFRQSKLSNRRRKTALSVILIDIDHFKQLNDTYGHLAGDQFLQRVATTLQETIRGDDLLFRWGGEEFLILLSDCNLGHAAQLAERIRQRVAEIALHRGEETLQATISLGTAELLANEDADHLIERADKALYRAKNNGRNRVEISG